MQKLNFDINLYDINQILIDIKNWFISENNINNVKEIPEEVFIVIVSSNKINQKIKKKS